MSLLGSIFSISSSPENESFPPYKNSIPVNIFLQFFAAKNSCMKTNQLLPCDKLLDLPKFKAFAEKLNHADIIALIHGRTARNGGKADYYLSLPFTHYV